MNITQNAIDPNITDIHKKCVVRCEDYKGYVTVINRCFLLKGNSTEIDDTADASGFLQSVTQDLANSWGAILISCAVALIFSYILLVLFRYAIKYVIWVIYIGIIALFFIGSVVFLVLFFIARNSKDVDTREASWGLLIAVIVFAVFAVVLGLLLFFFRRRIRLVIQLFKEASKAIADVPLIIAEPILTFLSLALTCFAFVYFAIVIESAGHLEVENDENGKFVRAEYQKNVGILAAHIFNLVGFIWFVQFIFGCQHFVIASTVSDWFFARTKSKLDSPISRGFSNLLRFHLGSICLGSMLITMVTIIRMAVNYINVSMT